MARPAKDGPRAAVGEFTLIVPFYTNVDMLREQLSSWHQIPDGVRIIVVDDGSPQPAQPIIEQGASSWVRERLQLYRINVNIPWNREGARNLASKVAETKWIVHVDIDHIMPPTSMALLLKYQADPKRWYRFERWRVGAADETRRKDKIPTDAKFGHIHPHVDSYLITKELYWKVGGYDERYSGCLGGGSPFLRQLENISKPDMLPADIRLHVFTRDAVKDASDHTLSRDQREYTRRRQEIERTKTVGKRPLMLNFPWERVL